MVKAKPSFQNVSFRFTFWHKWGSVLHFQSSIFGLNSFLTLLKNSKEQFFALKKSFYEGWLSQMPLYWLHEIESLYLNWYLRWKILRVSKWWQVVPKCRLFRQTPYSWVKHIYIMFAWSRTFRRISENWDRV